MEIKYEAVFGDQALFDGAPEDAEAVFKNSRPDSRCVYYRLSNGHERYFSGEWIQVPQIDSQTFNAMRRIIQEPKRWTLEDKLAGRLPEVGSMIWFINDMKQVEFAGTDGGDYLWYFKRDSGAFGSAYFNCFKPIETPAEKAARLRSEWCNRAMDHSTIQQLYDAMLSGELPVPVAPEQNK